jgi:hypothetical protein
MKKRNIGWIAVLGLLTACDPSVANIDMPSSDLTEQELSDGFTLKQYEEDYTTESTMGNYFEFFTSPARVVSIYQVSDDGSENQLVGGVANGRFKIVPKRGNPELQTFYIKTQNIDGSTVVTSKNVTVTVPSELTAEMRLLASDAYGYKVWKWDTDYLEDGSIWGCLGYVADSPENFVNGGYGGLWFGTSPEGLLDQLQHSVDGVATGEESSSAYMEFYDDGKIITYDAGGNEIRSGKYSVSDYDGTRHVASAEGSYENWSYGTLTTTEGAILFPFMINWRDNNWDPLPTQFEILQLDANHLKLLCPQEGVGSWGTATWWAFKSLSDPEASLTNFETKAWTWDTEAFGNRVWGNIGYSNGVGDNFVNNGEGIWWGCTAEELVGQLEHSDTGEVTGEEDSNAYMTFDWKTGTVKSYDASGKEIRSGKFEFTSWNAKGERKQASINGEQEEWAYGTLHTDGGSILFPFQMNYWKDNHDGVNLPTDFDVLQLDADHLKLVYASPGTPSWVEASYWAFKAKK